MGGCYLVPLRKDRANENLVLLPRCQNVALGLTDLLLLLQHEGIHLVCKICTVSCCVPPPRLRTQQRARARHGKEAADSSRSVVGASVVGCRGCAVKLSTDSSIGEGVVHFSVTCLVSAHHQHEVADRGAWAHLPVIHCDLPRFEGFGHCCVRDEREEIQRARAGKRSREGEGESRGEGERGGESERRKRMHTRTSGCEILLKATSMQASKTMHVTPGDWQC